MNDSVIIWPAAEFSLRLLWIRNSSTHWSSETLLIPPPPLPPTLQLQQPTKKLMIYFHTFICTWEFSLPDYVFVLFDTSCSYRTRSANRSTSPDVFTVQGKSRCCDCGRTSIFGKPVWFIEGRSTDHDHPLRVLKPDQINAPHVFFYRLPRSSRLHYPQCSLAAGSGVRRRVRCWSLELSWSLGDRRL